MNKDYQMVDDFAVFRVGFDCYDKIKVVDLIEQLELVVQEYGQDVVLRLNSDDSYDLRLVHTRLETDKEYAARLKEEKRAKELRKRHKERVAKKRQELLEKTKENELKLLAELKKKYES